MPSRENIRAVRTQLKRLKSLVEASRILNSTLNLEELLALILEVATRNLGASRGTIYLVDHEKKELWSKVLHGDRQVEIRLPFGQGVAGHVAETGKTMNIVDAYNDERFFSGVDQKSGFRTKTMLCMPMRNKDSEIIGVFQIINKRRGIFTKEDVLFLIALSIHASLAIENARLLQSALEKERMQKELQIARTIQRKLLPEQLPAITGVDVSAINLPSREVGGDLYDIIQLDEHRIAFVIADVAGKSVPAALLVSTLHASLHASISSFDSLPQLCKRLNEIIFKDSLAECYITCFICIVDLKERQLISVNAGHNVCFLLRGANILRLEEGGLPFGMFENADYNQQCTSIETHDLMILYTDGVVEAMDKNRQLYSEERFLGQLMENLTRSPKEIETAVYDDVRKFIGTMEPSDDFTLMVIRFTL
jgi:sigma-B regulation protein RsbU (phosphoserine phosphatase)